jgi:hypothetical protein
MDEQPKKKPARKPYRPKKPLVKPADGSPVLLSGGNPQIAKGYGNDVVEAYLSAMPGWKQQVGRRLDTLIVQTVPDVAKAIKWNTPFYGFEGQGWFTAFHCITRYIKVSFFRGTSLTPMPPEESKQEEVRYLHIHEDSEFDETQFVAWIRQASKLPLQKC